VGGCVVCSSVCRVHCNQSALPSYLSLSLSHSSRPLVLTVPPIPSPCLSFARDGALLPLRSLQRAHCRRPKQPQRPRPPQERGAGVSRCPSAGLGSCTRTLRVRTPWSPPTDSSSAPPAPAKGTRAAEIALRRGRYTRLHKHTFRAGCRSSPTIIPNLLLLVLDTREGSSNDPSHDARGSIHHVPHASTSSSSGGTTRQCAPGPTSRG
jgi:hypothetical protein